MTDVQTQTAATADDILAELGDLNMMDAEPEETVEEGVDLAALEALDEAVEEAVEEIDDLEELDDLAGLEDLALEAAVADDEDIDDDDLAAVERAIERQEVYNAQPAEEIVAGSEEKKTGKVATPRGSRIPKTGRDASALPNGVYVLEGDAAAMTAQQLDDAKTATLAAKPTQVKIAEKFENILLSIAAGKAPSHYTMIAFKLLDANKTITSGDIIAAYKATVIEAATGKTMGEGTARSQCGQMMSLFPALKVASRSGKTLTLNPNSNVAAALRKFVS